MHRVILLGLYFSLPFLLIGCASTPYKDVPVAKLTDQQLVDELAAASEGVGRQLNKAAYLMATRPDPFYVLSSSTTNYTGTADVSFSAYAVPQGRGYAYTGTGYGTYSGSAQTRYYYTDVNAFARLASDLGAAIASARAEANRVRGQEVLAELQTRAETRRTATQSSIDSWFAARSGEQLDKALVTAVLAWVPAGNAASTSDQLDKARAIIKSMERGPGLGGDWYGVFAQLSKLPDGRQYTINNFVRARFVQQGDQITGGGDLGTGERVEVEGRANGNQLAGTITNRGANMLMSASGLAESNRITLEYRGGSAQIQGEGKVILFR